MSDPMPIEYASGVLEQPADRLLRCIAAWLGIAYGAAGILGMALHIALANRWVASPPSMSWRFDGRLDEVMAAARTAVNAALLYGGVRLLNRSRSSIIILRAGAAVMIALTFISQAVAFRQIPTIASYWSTPAAAAVMALQFLGALWEPVVIVLLTLPPLARRMV